MKKKVNKLRVAIDGPAASGKNTLAKQIAKKYKLLHLDSGKLYRYFALQVHQSKDQKVNYTKLKQALKKLTLKKLTDKRLATEPVTKIASIISKKKRIRQMLKKVEIKDSGDSNFLNGELIDRIQFDEINEELKKQNKKQAKGERILLGIT